MTRYIYTDSSHSTVRDNDTGAIIPVDSGGWQGDVYRAWVEGGNVAGEPPSPTFADYVAQFTPGLQQWMEGVAKSNGYDSVLSCVSYKASGVAQFAGDAVAMISWRDELWKWASKWQAGFNGQLPSPIPVLQEVISLAPQPETYGWVVHTPGQVIESRTPVDQTA